jgi:hypothetical protein
MQYVKCYYNESQSTGSTTSCLSEITVAKRAAGQAATCRISAAVAVSDILLQQIITFCLRLLMHLIFKTSLQRKVKRH